MASAERVTVIDSHTAGEPTRVVIAGGPDLGGGSLAERRERFRDHHDAFRSAVVHEPRGSDAIVGALLCQPTDPHCVAGVIFFNNVGYLGMCGHGTMGVAVTLAHLGLVSSGLHRLDTPVGVVSFELHERHRVTIENVSSYRHRSVVLENDRGEAIAGDVAWGGNWFFLVQDDDERLDLDNLERLLEKTRRLRSLLEQQGIAGDGGAAIDHIELCGPPRDSANHGRNFVLCPGGAYDRSPCGTGTSAKLACLYADGKLGEGEVWRQEGVIGSVFAGAVRIDHGRIIPRITGEAHITAESTLVFEPDDPFRTGIRP